MSKNHKSLKPLIGLGLFKVWVDINIIKVWNNLKALKGDNYIHLIIINVLCDSRQLIFTMAQTELYA